MRPFQIVALAVAFAAGCTLSTNTTVNTAATTPPADTSGTPASAAAQSETGAAAAVVAELYKQHDAKKSPFFQTKDRGLVDRYFAKPLADLIWKDANNSTGEVGAIDGDPLYNAQDIEIKNFAVGTADVKGERATVPVTFTNYGQKVAITHSLKRTGGVWKIDNISYGGGDNLLKWLKDTYSGTKADQVDAFEGKYKVGDTTCSVRPSKMAFEVRWAKGSGIENFFYKDGTTYESQNEDGSSNQFIFDDDTFGTGTFVRDDGKSYPVKKIGS